MRRSAVIVFIMPALVLGSLTSLATAGPVRAAVCDGSGASLADGGFETPVVAANTFTLFPAASVPPWQTTDGAGEIEIWGDGFLGVPASAGNAFAELNANTAGTLYQDVVSTPGATMSWSLVHRGRGGDDVMQVLIGDANVADVSSATGWNFTSPDLTDGIAAWGAHGADYVVPAGQTCTRFAMRAVSTGSGSPSVGNFLDEVSFIVTAAPPPAPTPTPRPTVRVTSPPTTTFAGTDARDRGGSVLNVADHPAGRGRGARCPRLANTGLPHRTLTSGSWAGACRGSAAEVGEDREHPAMIVRRRAAARASRRCWRCAPRPSSGARNRRSQIA